MATGCDPEVRMMLWSRAHGGGSPWGSAKMRAKSESRASKRFSSVDVATRHALLADLVKLAPKGHCVRAEIIENRA
jgi:hypothetical protein